ncbi:N-acetyltransferase [Martelella lutilitoris]|uniref:N-acetyltransferase n=1 Tax=Martelella lutilitoris TaxID=2583532 RepID=A0A7T7KKY6_9HYPH|nr:GNAT family N-acetyltransferase [Martelella lutilitoris]QQM30125.1 N-acetyltransferase [Martelella lutilitoris]
MSVTIRPATAEDINAITEIYAESVLNGVASYELEPPTRAEMTARMETIAAGGFPYFAAVENDALLGYAYASAFRTRPAYRWLVENSVYLAPQARGRGVGKLLLLRLVEECEARGFRQMVAVIGGASPASMALHRSCGFADAGRLTGTGFKHGRWLDTVFMQRPLGAGNTTDPLPLSL